MIAFGIIILVLGVGYTGLYLLYRKDKGGK